MRVSTLFRHVVGGCLLISATAQGTSVKDIVSKSKSLDGTQVTVVGVAAVDGPHFVLYDPPRAQTLRGFSEEILVAPLVSGPRYLRLNNRWLKISGRIHRRERPTDYYGCILEVQTITVLRKPPVPEPRTLALFANQTSIPLTLRLYGRCGGIAAEFSLGRGGLEKLETSEVYEVKVFDVAGHPAGSYAPFPQNRSSVMFDQVRGTFYFRITGGKIALSPPSHSGDLIQRWQKNEATEELRH